MFSPPSRLSPRMPPRPKSRRFRLAAAVVVGLHLAPAGLFAAPPDACDEPSAPRWRTLPPTPDLGPIFRTGHLRNRGASLFYAEAGTGEPVLMLHGGMANANFLAAQARNLVADGYRVILLDSRGHGRSTAGTERLGYDLMMEDAVAVLDHLRIDKAAIIGWSDGAIVGLDLALNHADRISRVFAFGANVDPGGNDPNAGQSTVVRCFFDRARSEYQRLSPTPGEFNTFAPSVQAMWGREPHWDAGRLATIHTPVWVVDGDHDEMIRQEHTVAMSHMIPGAYLLILPDSSHFAFLQAPNLFHAALHDFLNGRP
ncbi:alpha/beta hydrolase [Acetobacter sacchari]|uniref:Alpha/beta hydrolase n=1 Tax=Acetobacter sacchari TaxID=2661687 RepID=A0ABS3LU57_9PROT|nr:alpha/beta hydrolase [Acetobacter sacchari]MBO1359443.1 alpha/beta hydrolase [Acetobacter sacchari]